MDDVNLFTSYFTEIKFGFTPVVSRHSFLHSVIQQLDLTKILSETDSPYFMPDEVTSLIAVHATHAFLVSALGCFALCPSQHGLQRDRDDRSTPSSLGHERGPSTERECSGHLRCLTTVLLRAFSRVRCS